MSELDVSVIIPCYNEEAYIERCLKSLLNQTGVSFEVIVVDDGSVDETLNLIKKFPVKLLQQNHRGPGLARNLGAKHSKGKILAFLDADMEFDIEFLSRLISPIINQSALGTFPIDEFVANQDNKWANCWTINDNLPLGRRLPLDYPTESIIFRAIKTNDFTRVGGYDDIGYGEDETLYRKLQVKSTGVTGAILYHNNPSSLSEVYTSARWIGKGEIIPRTFKNLLKYTFPISLIRGIIKTVRFRRPEFLVFKVVYDYGVLSGMILSLVKREHSK